jgi:UDP-N-acetylglucosamine--N-acetylmuramyl-(pentapeptide) pyrophosphoryl-undecaprenol N-acetylglucosamine transferase
MADAGGENMRAPGLDGSRVPSLMVAGGGTGGHVYAGVAVADAWRDRYGASTSIVFVGAQGRIEEKLVPRAGYPLMLLKLGSLKRVSMARRLKTFYQLPVSLLKSAGYLLKHKPQAVLGVGGFASGPLVLMARVLRMLGLTSSRTAILEQNSVPGFTNRVLGRFVDEVFCSFPGTETRFAGKHGVLVTGNPVRNVMSRLPSAARDPFTIFVFGGSQGAIGINSLVIEALSELRDLFPRLRFVHQTGEADYGRVAQAYRAVGVADGKARVEKFIYEMPQAYAESSLLVCRSGASTLAEIAAVGRASVLVPLPTAADNHQETNARVFSDAQAAFLLKQGQGAGFELARIVRECMADPARLSRMEQAVTAFCKPDAARDIVERLSAHG